MFKKIKVIPWTGGPLTPAECEEHVEAQQAQSLWEVVDWMVIKEGEFRGRVNPSKQQSGDTVWAITQLLIMGLNAQRIKRPQGME